MVVDIIVERGLGILSVMVGVAVVFFSVWEIVFFEISGGCVGVCGVEDGF